MTILTMLTILMQLLLLPQKVHDFMLTLARDIAPEDTGLAEIVGDDSLAGASVRDMLRGLLSSDAFRYRRTDAPAEEEVQP